MDEPQHLHIISQFKRFRQTNPTLCVILADRNGCQLLLCCDGEEWQRENFIRMDESHVTIAQRCKQLSFSMDPHQTNLGFFEVLSFSHLNLSSSAAASAGLGKPSQRMVL